MHDCHNSLGRPFESRDFTTERLSRASNNQPNSGEAPPPRSTSRAAENHPASRIRGGSCPAAISPRDVSLVGESGSILSRHVPNKAAVLDGVAEMVLAQLSVDTTDPDWAGQLRTVARDFRQLALTHPNVVPLLVTRPLATPLGQRPPGMLRPLEDVLALLTSAGFTGKDALHIYRVTCTATSSMSCRRLSSDPRKPTMCCGSVCTGSRSRNSLDCASWHPP